ncbi:MAG: DUF2284 domain-containing protein [Clostridiales bacterium]|nr:DUF2284 domain-containing protein [Clostridiales bacterium]
MLDYEALTRLAKEHGFAAAAPLDVKTLEFLPEVREMCAADKCHMYDKNWACPPACGPLEEMREKVSKYSRGLLVQTIRDIEDSYDWEGIQEAAELHAQNLNKLYDELKKQYPGLMAMGAGTCTRCARCAYLDKEPCRFPDELIYSMEACGLYVSKVCTDNGLKYNYGPDKIAYTSCFLLE